MPGRRRLTRRALLRAATLLAPPAAMAGTPVHYAGLPRLRSDDPVARSLLYTEDARSVPADHPLAESYRPGQQCAGCVQLRGNAEDAWRPCPAFPGRLVHAGGWCSIWAER